jgi:Xaa-Pro aminopeptidase
MTSNLSRSTSLVAARIDKLRERLANAPFDAILAMSASNVDYASGYRSVGAAVHGIPTIAMLVTPTESLMIGPVADSAPAFDSGFPEDDFVAYGRFYFESFDGTARATSLADQHPDYVSALVEAIARLKLDSATIGIDQDSLSAELRHGLEVALPAARWSAASEWLNGVRSQKLPEEVALLTRAAQLAEEGVVAALEAVRTGITEKDLARIVTTTMVSGGMEPRFTVVTSGERSALADAYATDRTIGRGDLLRFDIGGTLDGYWSDIGRTAVVGQPSDKQRRFYDAILAAEERQLAHAKPGVRASELFDIAVAAVEELGGPVPYRRQHCGHGIGLTTYEAPIVRPGDTNELAAGMVFCFETPYYELGWGGMMVEDALVITDSGCTRLTDRARELTVVNV